MGDAITLSCRRHQRQEGSLKDAPVGHLTPHGALFESMEETD
jgi:hypothetical protein